MMKFLKNKWMVFSLALGIRFGIVFVSSFLDSLCEGSSLLLIHFLDNVKYTDVDYIVFTDAARFVAGGESPYKRLTYRYTPLVSYLLVPNVIMHEDFGKYLFSLIDLLVAHYCHELGDGSLTWTNLMILFNPILINVSTRGNADQIVVLFVVLTLYYLKRDRIFLSAVFYALSMHTKIYPVIHFPALLIYLKNWNDRLTFTFVPFFLNIFLIGIFYYLYGFIFLYETYLYHLVRSDHRHNFSVYFYSIYVMGVSRNSILSILMFLPQMVLLLLFAILYGRNRITFTFFLQTLVFVCFNKVCTVQYFVWFIALLSVVITQLKHLGSFKIMLFVVLGWTGSLGLWLYQAYLLEFQGQNTFGMIWIAGLLFFVANVAVMVMFLVAPPVSVSEKKKIKEK